MTKALTEYKHFDLDIINDEMALDFKVLGPRELQKISEGMVDVKRDMIVFGRKNSQVTSKLMSLQMLKLGPMAAIKQADAQVNNKYNAIKENYFKIQKTKNRIAKYEHMLDNDELDQFKRRDLEISIYKEKVGLNDATVHVEHSLREIGMYMEVKKEIMEANNIREDFDEGDFIEAEIKENIMTMFQHVIRDLSVNGAANHGSLEWVEQFGIHPAIAYAEGRKYLAGLREGDSIDVTHLYSWYDEMYLKYKDEYKKAMKRLGIKNLVTEDVAYKE